MAKPQTPINITPDAAGRILGLDLSLTSTGWAFCPLDGQDMTGVVTVPYKGMKRLNDIRSSVEGFINLYRPTLIVIEGYSYMSAGGMFYLAELGGLIRMLCFLKQIPTIIVPPMTLKKFIAGKGNADKATMLLKVYKKFGTEFSDHNEADAFSLAKMGQALAKGEASDYLGKVRWLE